MAGYKETPRQKMIAMMYLVLTALLALNVSKEILDAFMVVNESMESTNESIAAKSDDAYEKFAFQNDLNPEKVGEFWVQAQAIQEKANTFIEYLEFLKYELVRVSERKDSTEIMNLYYQDTVINGKRKKTLVLRDVPTKDKYDATTNYMIGNVTLKNGEAYTLSVKMDAYRQAIIEAMGLPANTKKIGLITNADEITYRNADGQIQDWEFHNFYHTILAADVTIINKIIGEVRSAEFNAINHLYASVSETDFKFDKVAAKVIPKSTYLFQGQKYEAEVLVAAYDEKLEATLKVMQGVDTLVGANIDRATVYESEAGKGHLEFNTSTVGPQRYAGIIEMIDPSTNEMTGYPFSGEYIVAPPSLTVAPLKMNVFYIGVENPVSISVPGLAMDKVTTSISFGELYEDPNSSDYIVKVPKGEKEAIVSATAQIDGKTMNLGSVNFRVKRVPSPTATIAGQSDGQIDKNTLLAAGAIIPEMRDFDFDLYFEVTSFTFGTIVNGDWMQKNVRGNRFSQEIINIIRSGKRTQKFFFENIQAKGPDGTKRGLSPVNLELK